MRNSRVSIFWYSLVTLLVGPLVDASERLAVIQTNYGHLKLELFHRDMPKTVEHFIDLVQKGKYHGSTFYRVVKGNYIQGGIGYDVARKEPSIQREPNPTRKHVRGAVGFARQLLDEPNSGTTEVYICVTDQFRLDEFGFVAFGQVVEGFDVLDAIADAPVVETWKYWTPGKWVETKIAGSREVPWHKPVKPVVIESITIQDP